MYIFPNVGLVPIKNLLRLRYSSNTLAIVPLMSFAVVDENFSDFSRMWVGRTRRKKMGKELCLLCCVNHCARKRLLGEGNNMRSLRVGEDLQCGHAQAALTVHNDVFGPQAAVDLDQDVRCK